MGLLKNMNKHTKNIPKKAPSAGLKPKPQTEVKQSSTNGTHSGMSARDRDIALLTGVSLIIFICFHYTLHNQFLSDWDDWIYIPKDRFIKAFTAENFHNMLFKDITLNYYHPITLLSLALNYHFSQLNPWAYYFTNIVLHIANAVLVFYLIRTLMQAMVKVGYKSIPFIPWLAAVGALLHGLHPMHIESVAWIAERKDVLYAIFYFSGLIMYVRYTQGATFRWMLYVNSVLALACLWGMIGLKDFSLDVTKTFMLWDPLILLAPLLLLVAAIVAEVKYKSPQMGMFYVAEFFIFSMLSKPMAVSFPLAIIVVDFLLKRDLAFVQAGKGWVYNESRALVKFVMEKWMFFVIALLSGIQSAYMQGTTHTLAFTNGYTVFQKFLIACYTFTMYMVKAFYPANLNAFYPFPNLTSDYRMPSIFYVAPLFAAAIVFIPLYLTRKNNTFFRVILFGLGFYFANLVFVLQFLSSGMTIISERYSYIAYFGPIFVVIYFAHWFWQKHKKYHTAIATLLACVCVILFYLSEQRTKVWHDPETLWTDVINKTADQYPQTPYFNLASYYIDSAKYDKAYVDYSILVKIGSKDPLVFRNLAMIYGMRKQFDSSLYFFSLALQHDSIDPTIYTNRAITYANLGNLNLALKDFTKAYSLDTSQYATLAQAAGIAYQLKQYNEAISDYNTLIRKKPEEPSYYLLRGNAYLDGGNPQMAIQDYIHVLQLDPKNGECMYNMSIAYHALKDDTQAVHYATMAQNAGYKLPDNYLGTLK